MKCEWIRVSSRSINLSTLTHSYVEQLDKLLLQTGEKAWQPSDFVPDLTKEGWEDEVRGCAVHAVSRNVGCYRCVLCANRC